MALMTPGSRKLDGELGPERGADVRLGLRWCVAVRGRRCAGLGGECGDSGRNYCDCAECGGSTRTTGRFDRLGTPCEPPVPNR